MKKREQEQRPAARVCGPRRGVPLMMTTNVEDAVPATHPIRGVWDVVSALDWSGYLSRLRARGSRAGRPALDPRSLATLWVWAMSEGIVSARALARRCDTDFACRWALGGETVSHHTLSDFLRQDCGTLDALLSQTVGALHRSGAASFDTLLVDGTKVKARGGGGQFRERGGAGGDGVALAFAYSRGFRRDGEVARGACAGGARVCGASGGSGEDGSQASRGFAREAGAGGGGA